jgi:hypothetical protein
LLCDTPLFAADNRVLPRYIGAWLHCNGLWQSGNGAYFLFLIPLLFRNTPLQSGLELLFRYNGAYLAVFSSLQAYFDTYLRCNEPYLAYYTPKVSCNAALLYCNGHCKPTPHHCNVTMDRCNATMDHCCLQLACKSLTTITISLQKSIVSDSEVIVSLQLPNYT